MPLTRQQRRARARRDAKHGRPTPLMTRLRESAWLYTLCPITALFVPPVVMHMVGLRLISAVDPTSRDLRLIRAIGFDASNIFYIFIFWVGIASLAFLALIKLLEHRTR